MFVDNLIIGNGFAGRSVAHVLNGDTLIVDRGEKVNIFERRQLLQDLKKADSSPHNSHFAMIRAAWASKLPFNQVSRLGHDCLSEYILVDGGCSNHWGGLSFRLTENVFSTQSTDFQWPFNFLEVKKFYAKAENLLKICIDPADPEDRKSNAEIKGVKKWRDELEPFFPKILYWGSSAQSGSSY